MRATNAAMSMLFDEGYDIPRLLMGIQAETGECIVELSMWALCLCSCLSI